MPLHAPRMMVVISALAILALSACDQKSAPSQQEVVVYCSVDAVYARPIFESFTQSTGIMVRPVFDTEATKTTGLLLRLLAEKDRPRADLWWSSEALATVRLSAAGVLAPYRSDVNEAEFPEGWPTELRGDADGSAEPLWYGLARRARVVVARSDLASPPRTIDDLGRRPELRGRIGMARPQFGTTRSHMAALLAERGEAEFRSILEALSANGIRLYDGNSAVVRAIASGEIVAGLTDSDDYRAGLLQGWPLACEVCAPEQRSNTDPRTAGAFPGAPAIPNTIAMIKGGPNPANAARLFDELLSARTEEALAKSESGNLPVRAELQPLALIAPSGHPPFPDISCAQDPDWTEVESFVEAAMRLCDEVLSGR